MIDLCIPKMRKQRERVHILNDGICENREFIYNFFFLRLKKSLLGECTKVQFYETKKQNRTTLTGYVAAADKLHPFQEKIPADSEMNSKTVLWNKIKLASPYLNEWNALFGFNHDKHHETL